MISLTQDELEYINNFYTKDGEVEVVDIDKIERLCIISIPVIDTQEDEMIPLKIITIPIDYNYDGEDVVIYNTPDMLDDNDIYDIIETIWEAYE